MESGLYVTLSGQMALMRRLENARPNVANTTTPGFGREDQVRGNSRPNRPRAERRS